MRKNWSDYKDSKWLACGDLGGVERTATVEGVAEGVVKNVSGQESTRLLVKFKEHPKPMIINATNRKRITGLYGSDPEACVGKKLTLYPSEVSVAGDLVPCIRVKDSVNDDAESLEDLAQNAKQ